MRPPYCTVSQNHDHGSLATDPFRNTGISLVPETRHRGGPIELSNRNHDPSRSHHPSQTSSTWTARPPATVTPIDVLANEISDRCEYLLQGIRQLSSSSDRRDRTAAHQIRAHLEYATAHLLQACLSLELRRLEWAERAEIVLPEPPDDLPPEDHRKPLGFATEP